MFIFIREKRGEIRDPFNSLSIMIFLRIQLLTAEGNEKRRMRGSAREMERRVTMKKPGKMATLSPFSLDRDADALHLMLYFT